MKKSFNKEANNGNFRVTIFGSARIKNGNKEYNDVKKLARMLGKRGFDVITGGGPGLMEAVSRGHREGSKKTMTSTIGIGIKLPKKQRFNKFINVKKEFHRFSKRLDTFMALSNVVIVAPGGIGTLLELFYTWQLAQVEHICNIPIILVGEQWPPLIDWIEKYPLKNRLLKSEDVGLLFLADDYNEAIKMIDKAYEKHKKGDKNFCLNYYRSYKLN